MSYTTVGNDVNHLWQGEITRKISTFSSKKLFAVLLKGDSNLYTIDIKRLPKNRPRFVSPFTRELKFNESTRSIGLLAEGWRKLDLRKCNICSSSSDSKIFKVLIPIRKKGAKSMSATSTIKKERFQCSNACLRKIWIKKLNQAKTGSFDEPLVPATPRLITHFDCD